VGRTARGCRLLGMDLRRRRGERSLREVARLSGSLPCAGHVSPIPPSSLHQIEQGLRLPNVEQMRTLSLLYNVPVQRLYALLEADGEEGGLDAVEGFLALRERADLLRRMDRPCAYLTCLQQCEETAEGTATFVWVRRARALALREQGQGEEAAGLLLDLLSRDGVPEEELASIWLEASEAYEGLGNLEVAEAAARRGLERVLRCDEWTRSRLDAALGRILRRTARRDGDVRSAREAVRRLERAMETIACVGLTEEVGRLETELGLAHLAAEDRLLGFEMLRRALATCLRPGGRRHLAFAHKAMGEALLEGGEAERARHHLRKAETLAAGGRLPDLQFQSVVLLCEAEEALGGRPAAMLRRARGLLPWLRVPTPERERFERQIFDEPLVREEAC